MLSPSCGRNSHQKWQFRFDHSPRYHITKELKAPADGSRYQMVWKSVPNGYLYGGFLHLLEFRGDTRPFFANISGENSAKFKAPNQVQNQNAGYGFVST